MDNISLVESDLLNDKIAIVLRQTDYSESMAREKLSKFNYNEMDVIRDYFGISVKKEQPKPKSLNQEIYKQLRGHLDSAMKDYRGRVDKGEAKTVL
jgi:hypothetical protein